MSCFEPCPCVQSGTITPDDLARLEHSLLFRYKQPGDIGAKLWNGMIFRLSPNVSGFAGQLQAVDLNRIIARMARSAT